MAEGVRAAGLATQGVGEAAEVVEGVWQIKLPVPFSLGFVSVYLVEAGDGWTLIDAGYDYPPAREAWEAGPARPAATFRGTSRGSWLRTSIPTTSGRRGGCRRSRRRRST